VEGRKFTHMGRVYMRDGDWYAIPVIPADTNIVARVRAPQNCSQAV
jgi:hypothetical protein